MGSAPRRAGGGWFTLFTLAWLAIWTVQLTPVQLLLPLQLNTPDDASGWIGGVVSSGVIMAIGGLVAIIAGPVSGALSDRTRSKWGRRRPWALAGVWLMALCLVALASATSVWAVALAWVGVSVGVAVASAAFTALIADQLREQRGAASAAVSSSQALGIIVGVGAVVLLGLGVADAYLVLAGFIAVVGTVATALLPDPLPARSAEPAGSASEREAVASAPARRFTAFRDRKFAWMLGARLVVNIGNALGTALLLFFILYGLHEDPGTAEDRLLLLILVYTVFVVGASIWSGRISDRSGRRKGIVVGAAILQGLAAALILAVPTFELTMVAAAFLGVGYGAFSSVGLALATDLLANERDHARDLGVVNVAMALGQLLGPLIGAGLVALVGGFWLVFAVSAVLSIIGGLMHLPIVAARNRPSGGEPCVAWGRSAPHPDRITWICHHVP